MDQEEQMDRNRNGVITARPLPQRPEAGKRWQVDIVEQEDLPLAHTKPVPAAAPKSARAQAPEGSW